MPKKGIKRKQYEVLSKCFTVACKMQEICNFFAYFIKPTPDYSKQKAIRIFIA
jgi:hypothetical protein